MASETPQVEDGFVRVANEIFDAILGTEFSKRELLLVMAVVRKTYGFGKREDDVTMSQLAYMTGLGRANVSRTYHALVARKVLISRDGEYGNIVSLNKRYWEWDDRVAAVPRRAVMERDEWTCQECGRQTPERHSGLLIDSAPELDHIVEISAGGSEDESNLQCLCRRCHQNKTRDYLRGRVEGGNSACQNDTRAKTTRVPNRHEPRAESTQSACRIDTKRVPNRHKARADLAPTIDNPNRQLQKTTPKDKGAAALPATGPTWAAYAAAYEQRYGVPPVRNATVNAQVANLVKRIGDDAPHVAQFFVAHNNAFYVRRGHAVGALLADAEKLRTEWATNRRVTDTQARQADRTQANGDVWANLLAKAEAHEANN